MQPSTNQIRYTSFLVLLGLVSSLVGPSSLHAGQGVAPQQPQTPSPSVWAAPPAGQQPSAFQSACGSQPMCYDTPNFAVAIIDFRMSMARGAKVMDATLRFVNKTNQPLILGYVDNSAVALDDQGNRYGTYYNTGLSGIGLVNGMTMDAKFTLQPTGAGDARFELYWRPGAQDPIGGVFDLGMTIREITTLPGGQHTLGGEFPLHFQGLANGAVGGAPSYSGAASPGVPSAASSVFASGGGASLPPCGPSGNAAGTVNAISGVANSAGGQQTANATNTATGTANNAMAQLAGLKSLFGKKNAAAPATNVAGAANCIPAATPSAMPVAAGPSSAPATAGQVVNAVPAATPPGATVVATPAAAPVASAKPPVSTPAARKAVAPATGSAVVQPNGVKPMTPPPGVPANGTSTTPARGNSAARPALVNAAAPNTKPAAQPAASATPAKRAVPPPPGKKPATTAATPPANPASK